MRSKRLEPDMYGFSDKKLSNAVVTDIVDSVVNIYEL